MVSRAPPVVFRILLNDRRRSPLFDLRRIKLTARSQLATVRIIEDLMARKDITKVEENVRDELVKQLGPGDATLALAVALGRVCAENGLDLSCALAQVETAHGATLGLRRAA